MPRFERREERGGSQNHGPIGQNGHKNGELGTGESGATIRCKVKRERIHGSIARRVRIKTNTKLESLPESCRQHSDFRLQTSTVRG